MPSFWHKATCRPDVSLFDEDAGVVNGFGQTQLEDLCLEATLQEVFLPKTQHVIQLHLVLIQHTNAHQATQQGITWDAKQF